jgi:hypothetical protein
MMERRPVGEDDGMPWSLLLTFRKNLCHSPEDSVLPLGKSIKIVKTLRGVALVAVKQY